MCTPGPPTGETPRHAEPPGLRAWEDPKIFGTGPGWAGVASLAHLSPGRTRGALGDGPRYPRPCFLAPCRGEGVGGAPPRDPASSPLNRSIGAAACAPRGSARAALRSPRSAPSPGPPRWPLPVRSRSRPDLLARLPRPSPGPGPRPARRPRGGTPRPAPEDRQLSSPLAPGAPLPRQLLHVPVPRLDQTLGEAPGRGGLGRLTGALLPTTRLRAHCQEVETEVCVGRLRASESFPVSQFFA
ncbi:PREDICTED: translation initiation factor IF-2-like [Capra hircus]|uniref:translation initiation factor IF-2-like n=1 Tax=Capra hircus TaxID=9925 RepID=UPI0008464772|nr:PREDICTED: translation initiation factor IF-2-like [Capra hircus]